LLHGNEVGRPRSWNATYDVHEQHAHPPVGIPVLDGVLQRLREGLVHLVQLPHVPEHDFHLRRVVSVRCRVCVCGGLMSAYEGGIERLGRALDLLGLALFGDPPRELLGERLHKDLPPAAAAHSVP
jgi:hypothetical protein